MKHTLRTMILSSLLIVIGVVLHVAVADAQSFPQNDNLQRELAMTAIYCKRLKPKLTYVQTKVNRANYVLSMTKRISDTTDKMEQRLKANIDVLLPFTFIPNVGKITKPIRRGLKVVHKRLKPINRTMKKAEKTIAPYRKPLPKVSRALGWSQKGFRMTCQMAAAWLKSSLKVETCLRRLQSGALKTKLVRKFEAQAKHAAPIIAKVNRVLKAVDETTNTANRVLRYPAFLYPEFVKFNRAFRPIELMLNYTHYPIKYLRIALRSKITITVPKKFKVRFRVKFNPLKPRLPKFRLGFVTKKIKVSFTVRQILDGIDGPFKYLEKQFMKLALKKLGPVSVQLRKLKGMMDGIRIPGWSGFATKLRRIQIEVRKIKLFSTRLLIHLSKLNLSLGYTLRNYAFMIRTIRCYRCRGASYLTASGSCKSCRGNTYAKYGATSCRVCPRGTFQVGHYRCVKKVVNCLTHPKFPYYIRMMKQSFRSLLFKQCRYSAFRWGKSWLRGGMSVRCAAGILWHYSPQIPRSLGCRMKGGYSAFVRLVMKKYL